MLCSNQLSYVAIEIEGREFSVSQRLLSSVSRLTILVYYRQFPGGTPMRKFLQSITLPLMFGLVACGVSAQPSADRPNFLIITTDDMGYTDLGAFGGRDIPTPNLDRLAREGVRFSNFHATPSCAPTRASLMTGNGNHEAGLGTQLVVEGLQGWGYERFLQDRVMALPEVLQRGDYYTVMAGKWHIGSADPSGGNMPRDRGFDRDFSLLQGADSHYQSVFKTQDEYSEDGVRLADLPDDFYSTTAYTDKLIEFLQDRPDADQPFFAWFAPTAPHWPLMYPPGWEGRYAGAYDAGFDQLCIDRMAGANAEGVLPPNTDIEQCSKTVAPWDDLSADEQALQARFMEVYASMVDHLDQEIGRLLTYMESAGLLDNTWIIFHNDNGPQGGGLGIRGMGDLNRSTVDNSLENIGFPNSWVGLDNGWADAISSPFREGKATQYEGGIRVAAFAWHANYHAPGEVDPQYLHVMDIMPTLMDFAGVYAPVGNFEGRQLLPMRGVTFGPSLLGSDQAARDFNDSIALSSAGKSMLVQGDWKITYHAQDGWLLFNLADDPGERNDLSLLYPERFSQMRTEFDQVAEERNYRHPN